MDRQQAVSDFWKEAHQLISVDDGTLMVKKEVLEALKQIASNLCVVGIIGKYREGKSFFMNRLVREKHCFDTSPTVQAQTKGIWIKVKEHPSLSDHILIALDTQGLFAVKKRNTDADARIFTATLLLCNCLIYNLLGKIDDGMVQLLALTTELSKRIKKEGGKSIDNPTPLVVLLRDFSLALEIDGQTVTADEYLEYTFGANSDDKNVDSTSECIPEYFSPRQCFTIPQPFRTKQNVDDDEIVDDQLNGRFLRNIEDAIVGILENAQQNIRSCNSLCGKEFAVLVEKYVDGINEGKVPFVGTIIDNVRQTECQKALDSAMKTHHQQMEDMKTSFPIEEETFENLWVLSTGEAMSVFEKMAIFDKDSTFKKQLEGELKKSKNEYERQNNESSSEVCQNVLKQRFQTLKENIRNGTYMGEPVDHERFTADKMEAEEGYTNTEGKGPMATKELNKYLQRLEDAEQIIRQAKKAGEVREANKRKFEEKIMGKLVTGVKVAVVLGVSAGAAVAGVAAACSASVPIAVASGAGTGVLASGIKIAQSTYNYLKARFWGSD